tara:strand:- start:292 stop:1674 length:1383 start_codon:yes stop_codon:yes gene_type:complete
MASSEKKPFYMIKYLSNKIFISLTILFLTSSVNASHFDGYDISYKHISGLTYEIEVEFLNSISGFPSVPDSLIFEVSSTCASGYRFAVYNTQNTAYVSPNCLQAFSQSKTTTYRNNYTFPVNGCSDFEIKLSSQNYINGNTSNVNYLLSNNKKVTINGVGLLSNNSPKFIGKFKRYSNINEITNYNLGAYETDGDSLVYKIVNTSRNYNLGFSASAPFGNNQLCSIDSKTGILTSKISTPGFFLVNIEVEEYRSGNLIGKTHREWIIHVIQGTQNQFSISGINFSNKYDTTICKGDTLLFLFQALNGNNTVLPFLEGNFTGAVISTVNGISNFEWIPDSSLNTNSLYNFYVNAESNDCSSYSKAFSVSLSSCIAVGMAEKAFTPNFELFPNPSSGVITLRNSDQNIRLIEIRDLTGKLIEGSSGIQTTSKFDLTAYPNGIYFVTQKTNNNILTKKLILSK